MCGFRMTCARLAFVVALIPCPILVHAQDWQTADNNPGNVEFYKPEYPVAFVAAPVVEVPATTGGGPKLCTYPEGHPLAGQTFQGKMGQYDVGTDVLSANNPSKGNELRIYIPDRGVKKLFPRDIHKTLGLIDTPGSDLSKGSVVEPNISEDGKRIIFSFFHDVTDKHWPVNIPAKGADLYTIDISELLVNPSVSLDSLPVKRLTFKTYGSDGVESFDSRMKDAINIDMASEISDWGNVFMHAEEVRAPNGELQLVFASDKRRAHNSNTTMDTYRNHNFSIFRADINDDGSLGTITQDRYDTTTSALSVTKMKDGYSFSYQSNTEDGRNWQVQGVTSNGSWYPLFGYGKNPNLIHLGSFCVKTKGQDPGDYFIATEYYNSNNEGFGALWAQDLAKVGINDYNGYNYTAKVPVQVGSYILTDGVEKSDDPSSYDAIDGWVGKFSSPRCGKPDELYVAYTPTSANGRLWDNNYSGNITCDKNIYHSQIAFRPNLETFHPHDPIIPAQEKGLRTVVQDASNTFTLVWPVPVISWQERSGDAEQQFQERIEDKDTTITPGLPFAQVGTSALYNTDRKPFDCWLGQSGQTPYTPQWTGSNNINNENDKLYNNQDGLTYVQDQSNFCMPLQKELVLGVAINLTSNNSDWSSHPQNELGKINYVRGFQTDGSGNKEALVQLGIYDIRNQDDQSFMSVIPANVPFEFKLLDKRYGLKLVDVRSWHALKPLETRNDCGGCHNHEAGAGIPFEGKYADSNPPLDLTDKTTYIDYDPECKVLVKTSNTPTTSLPEWKTDIFPKFDQYCGKCHNTTSPDADSNALEIFDYDDELEAYVKLRDRNFASSKQGAMGSPAFWAARGQRTDGRDNSLSIYVPDLNTEDGTPTINWGYRFSQVHKNQLGLCDVGDQEKASWVYKLGLWIDNHMPRDTGLSYGYTHDWFHPTIASALAGPGCAPNQIRIGYWDDTGIVNVDIYLNGVKALTLPNLENGSIVLPLSSVSSDDVIKIIASDLSGNRHFYETNINELVEQCNHLDVTSGSGGDNGDPGGDDSGGGDLGGDNPGSGGDDPTPTPTPQPDSATLTLEGGAESYLPGDIVSFKVDSSIQSTFYSIACSETNSLGQVYNELQLQIDHDQLFERTVSLFGGNLELGQASYSFRIPTNFKQYGDYFCQAIIGNKVASNMVTLVVEKVSPKKRKKIKQKLAKKKVKIKSKIQKKKAKKKGNVLATSVQALTDQIQILKDQLKSTKLQIKHGKVTFGTL